MSRQSFFVKVGRIYQALSPAWSRMDALFNSNSAESHEYPVVCILAPPRSGSTLLYQILTTGIGNQHLTNIWNLLYATPIVGGRISRKLTAEYYSDFKSSLGFVSGFAGEAEGMAFWEYWAGQGMIESQAKHNGERLAQLHEKLKHVLREDEAFICGFLGHVFCIDLLRENFPDIKFVYLRRNLVENALSLYKASPDKFISSRPADIDFEQLSRKQQIVEQLLQVHRLIVKGTAGCDVMRISYDQLCESPRHVINQILTDWDLTERSISKVPEYFEKRAADTNSPIANEFRKLFTERIGSDVHAQELTKGLV